MTLDTQKALQSAAGSTATTGEERAAIERLRSAPIEEARIKPVVDQLVGRWKTEGSFTLPAPPILGPILWLESVRLAEAVNRLEKFPGAEIDLADLPPLNQEMLDQATLTIDKDQLRKLQAAVSRLGVTAAGDRLEARSREIQTAAALLQGLAADCAGPLGAVYGTAG